MRPSFISSMRSSAKGGSRGGAHEALAPLVVAGLDAHGTVDVEAVARRREARLLAVQVFVTSVLAGGEGPAHERAAREAQVTARARASMGVSGAGSLPRSSAGRSSK